MLIRTPFKTINNEKQFKIVLEKFISKFQLPQYVLLIEGDNKLVINLKNLTSVKMLLLTIKNRNLFTLKEFLFNEDSVVKNKNGKYYTNQFIIPFYKQANMNN